MDVSTFFDELPPFFNQVATAGGLLPYANNWLAGTVEPWYETETDARPLNVVEKIVAARAWAGGRPGEGGGPRFGISSVGPGDQVLCRAGFRGMHEYTAGMVMDLYEKAFGRVPVQDPDLCAAFEDHFVLIDQPTVPDAVKNSRLGPAKQLAAEMVEARTCAARSVAAAVKLGLVLMGFPWERGHSRARSSSRRETSAGLT